jgi:hypothetical protein
MAPVLQSQLQAAATLLPDTVTIMSANTGPGVTDPRDRLQLIRTAMQLSPLVAFGFWAVFALVVVLSFKNWLDWLAIPMLVAGFFSSLAAIVGGPVVRLFLEQILARNMPAYFPPIFLDYAGDLAAEISTQFLQPVIWQGLLIAVVGFIMLALSFILKQTRRPA